MCIRYISVTTFDDDLERKSVDAKRIPPFDSTGQVAEETTSENNLESLLTTPNLLVAGLAILSLLLLLAIVRGRNSKSQ